MGMLALEPGTRMPPLSSSVDTCPPSVVQASSQHPKAASSGVAKRKPKQHFAIPKVAFRRLVQEIAGDMKSDLRFQPEAIEALQECAERLVTENFERCSHLAELCKLDTVRHEHWRFVLNEQGAIPCSDKS
jgi:histone H3/H4